MLISALMALLLATDARPQSAELNDAIEKVKQIINQPVASFPRDPDVRVAVYSPGWFHQGAIKPNFMEVDVRKTQELSYSQHEYVTSDLNPAVMFHGADVEFNS